MTKIYLFQFAFNSLDWSKLKAFAYDEINVNEKLKIGLGILENIL